ncbi:hypothetical protein B5X24_HaOG200474 [Helicoverpa armigera]|uniref:Peptidase S1 domain-containing protein n=1 Tax=Helicoverpa armigera TaxID=29058 RepID=A0A2W1BVM6_HELAM|nr:hypothetical protein B5X24_HaOG200474 [Helicoverpa armigera]
MNSEFHLFLFSVLCVLFSNISASGPSIYRNDSSKHLRIIDGTDADESEYPYVVLLIQTRQGWGRMCTASLISERWGITAAHCKNYFPYGLRVWTKDFNDFGKFRDNSVEIAEMITHPSYRLLIRMKGRHDIIVSNDVALFRLQKTVRLPRYARLSSVDRDTLMGRPAIYIGGGARRIDGFNPLQGALQKGEGVIVPCDTAMKRVSKYVICTASKCSKRAQRIYYGDSGGPLIMDGQVVGVCSYVMEHGTVTSSGYAPVSCYLDWIYSVIHSRDSGEPRTKRRRSRRKLFYKKIKLFYKKRKPYRHG